MQESNARQSRWLLRSIVGTVVAAAVVGAGLYFARPFRPIYRSTAQILIKREIDVLLYRTELSAPIPDYDAYMETQRRLASTKRMIMRAMDMKHDAMNAIPEFSYAGDRVWPDVSSLWGNIDYVAQLDRFEKSLKIHHPPNTQLLVIQFDDDNPNVPPVASKLLAAAYLEAAAVDTERFVDLVTTLKAKSKATSSLAHGQKETMRAFAGEFGTLDFTRQLLQKKQAEWLDADARLQQGEASVRGMAWASLQTAEAAFANGDTKKAETIVGELLSVWPQLFSSDSEIQSLRERVARRGSLPPSGQTTPVPLSTQPAPESAPGTLTLAEANARLRYLRESVSNTKSQIAGLQARVERMEAIAADLKVIEEELASIQKKQRELEFEGISSSRISLLSVDPAPTSPLSDKRFAAAGIGAGSVGFLGTLMIGLVAWVKRRRARGAGAKNGPIAYT